MPATSDRTRIRAVLNRDRPWTLYLLGDLEPAFFARGEWWCSEHAVVLRYHGFELPVLLAVGGSEHVRPLFDEMPQAREVYLHVREEILDLIRERYVVPAQRRMIRMVLAPENYRPVDTAGARPLGPADADALVELYRDGEAAGESPGFFNPEMVRHGAYFGVHRHGELVAVAGTHLLSPNEGVAAIGNVYTRRDCRGRGLGALTTSAVANALLADGFDTVALSVNAVNETALRLYLRLGFHQHCRFVEGMAFAKD